MQETQCVYIYFQSMGQLMPTYYLYITYSINNQLVGGFLF